MKRFGKTIKLFLLDGEPNGRMTCELSNWTGKAIKIPRNKLKESADRTELTGTGIYILFGKSDLINKKGKAYIGEAEGIYKRLTQHLQTKEFWTEAIVFISKDENLNKAHIKYLESRLYELAVEVSRFELENNQTPTKSSISEADEAEMEEFLDNLKLLINTLGYNIFEPIRKESADQKDSENNTFYVTGARGANASGQVTNEGFVVFKGSEIADPVTNSFPQSWRKLRQELIQLGTISNKGEKLVFEEDYLFSSPSTAAAIVMGRSANGLAEWKLKDGKRLKDLEGG